MPKESLPLSQVCTLIEPGHRNHSYGLLKASRERVVDTRMVSKYAFFVLQVLKTWARSRMR
jgi:hypothetical protein